MQQDTIAKTLASLVYRNDGAFKTAKQVGFILSKCDNGVYETTGSVYNNSYNTIYYCNEIGVYKVDRCTKKQGCRTVWNKGQETQYKIRQAELAKEKEKLKAIWSEEKKDLLAKITKIKEELNKPSTIPFMVDLLQDILANKKERLASIEYSLIQ